MERVETLLQKLQLLHKENASIDQLLLTTQMLQHELMHLQSKKSAASTESIIVSMPFQMPDQQPLQSPSTPGAQPAEEKTVEVLEVDEDEIAAELEEIRRNAAAMLERSSKE
jgi:hypothetical protein